MSDYSRLAVFAARAAELDPWRVSNACLYRLCAEHPTHEDDAATAAKLLVIGRVYAATLERGRGSATSANSDSDAFYLDHAAPTLRKSRLDYRLKRLSAITEIFPAAIPEILRTHGYLMSLFRKLTGRNKRSLASKYLHFHLPQHFFILDSRAIAELRKHPAGETTARIKGSDPVYSSFVGRASTLREQVAMAHGVLLSPRELDRLLLHSVRATVKRSL